MRGVVLEDRDRSAGNMPIQFAWTHYDRPARAVSADILLMQVHTGLWPRSRRTAETINTVDQIAGDTVRFGHEQIDSNPPSGRLSFCLAHDLTGNGRPDIIIGAMGLQMPLSLLGRQIELRNQPGTGDIIRRLETNLFWYENPGWERHRIADVSQIDVGGTLGDITGNGRLDLVVGQGINHHDLYWLEQPNDPRDPWDQWLITDVFEKYHDVAVADVDNDGEPEVVGLSQESEVVFYYDIPDDPRRSPWPDGCRHIVAEDIEVEGLEVVDIDGDGQRELIAGPNIFRQSASSNDAWERERIAPGWEWTRIAVADIDGDGELEVVLAEGDRPYADGRPGRVGWFDPPDWTVTVLRDDLFCPHSLQVADFTDNGHLDIYVAEMGLGENTDPKQFVFHNEGDGEFKEELVFSGIPTHEAKAVDVTGNGQLDIVGKSYAPTRHVDVWYNEP